MGIRTIIGLCRLFYPDHAMLSGSLHVQNWAEVPQDTLSQDWGTMHLLANVTSFQQTSLHPTVTHPSLVFLPF